MVRLQKFLADAGVASRRASEQMITDGRVMVNGQLVRLLGTKVNPNTDTVTVDGKPAKPRRKLYVALNKPRGYVCSRKDELGRQTVFDLLPTEWGNLHSVGRLDYDSEGLLFLTNDGEFSLHLTHPRHGVRKTYTVQVDGRVEDAQVQRLRHGVIDKDQRLQAESARVLRSGKSGSLLEVVLTEGKNREIRRMFAALGHTVTRLQRVQIGKIKLGELRLGRWRTLTEPEIETLLNRL